MKRIIIAIVGLLIVLGLGATGFVYFQAASRTLEAARYVALGSSFASGPAIGEMTREAPSLCMQSEDDYPHQLARKRGLTLTDVTCSGATTRDILTNRQFFQVPQIEAIIAETELVTITIGGNDVNYSRNLIGHSAEQGAGGLMTKFLGVASDEAVEAGFEGLQDRLEQIAHEARQRAPNVRVIFVPYLTTLPPSGTCAAIGMTEASADKMRGIAARLNAATETAARNAGADYLDMAALSRDHHACSAALWVQTASGAVPFHPNLAGITAIAEALDQYLSASGDAQAPPT
jgi:lysophospholipase L1-like esterase